MLMPEGHVSTPFSVAVTTFPLRVIDEIVVDADAPCAVSSHKPRAARPFVLKTTLAIFPR
jgi:hypothetical protein